MKVYYHFKDSLVEKIDQESEDKDAANYAAMLFYDRLKYMMMWSLRHMEQVINEEGGMIIINRDGKIETKGFTKETTKKIGEILAKALVYE